MREFETQYREALRLRHSDHMSAIASSGTMSDEAAEVFKQVAGDVSAELEG